VNSLSVWVITPVRVAPYGQYFCSDRTAALESRTCVVPPKWSASRYIGQPSSANVSLSSSSRSPHLAPVSGLPAAEDSVRIATLRYVGVCGLGLSDGGGC
jgi:hypothetical protein